MYYTNSDYGAWGSANWTNQSGAAMNPGATAANWIGSNLVFNTAGISTNNVGTGASFGYVSWLASVTNFVSSSASRYYWIGFTNLGNNTVLFAPRVLFTNQSIAPVIYNEGQLTMSGIMSNYSLAAITFESTVGATTTVSGAIGLSNGLIKTGLGVLILSGANTYSGGTTLNAGTLVANNNDALGTGLLTMSGGTLSNMSDRTLANDVKLSVNSTIGVLDATTLTLSGAITDLGKLTKQGLGTLALTGNNSFTGGVIVSAGTLNVSGTNLWNSGDIVVQNNSVMNIQGGLTTGRTFYVGHTAGTGIVNQTAGTLNLAGQNGLLVGMANTGLYNLYGGTLNAQSGAFGILLGVQPGRTGIFNMTNGLMTTKNLYVGRPDSAVVTNSSGFYYQSGGTATVATLTIGGRTASNTYGYFSVSNAAFTATNFTFLAASSGSTGELYLAQGGLATLPAFPTARGVGSIANLTFDGGTLSPIATSPNYMSNLTHAFITTNGAIFDVASGKDITVAQGLEDAAGQAGKLTKQGVGALTLSGANTYRGGTTISGGTLALTAGGTLGSGNVGVGAGATLSNRGTITGGLIISSGALATGGGHFTGSVTNQTGGTLTPGTGGDTNFFNTLVLEAGSTNSFWIGSHTTHDMSVVSNSLSLAGTGQPVLKLDLSSYNQSALPYNSIIVLYDNVVSNTLDGAIQWFTFSDAGDGALSDGVALYNDTTFSADGGSGATNTFTIHYDYDVGSGTFTGNSIALVAIPEPASILSLLGAAAVITIRRRIRKVTGRWSKF